jgi:hypothetical protein
MDRHNRIFAFLLILAVIPVACAPLLPAVAQLPTQPAGAVSTYIAGTRVVAATETAKYVTPSRTPTITFTPSRTPTITPTATATFIFKFSTFTPAKIVSATNSSGGGDSGGSGGSGGGKGGGGTNEEYNCKVSSTIIRVNNVIVPSHPLSVPPNTIFTVTWTVKNTGKTTWEHYSTDYKYISGTKFNSVELYDFPDLPAEIRRGETVDLVIDNPLSEPPPPAPMKSPSKPGPYTARWRIFLSASGNLTFCDLIIEIVVQ